MVAARSRMEEEIRKIAATLESKESINIPIDFELDELYWDFSGEIKFLKDCSKDELLHVIKVLCRKYAYLASSISEHSSTNVHTEPRQNASGMR